MNLGDNSTGTTPGQAAILRLSSPFIADLQTIIFRDCVSYREVADSLDILRESYRQMLQYADALADAQAAMDALNAAWARESAGRNAKAGMTTGMRALDKAIQKLEKASEYEMKKKESKNEGHGKTFQATRY